MLNTKRLHIMPSTCHDTHLMTRCAKNNTWQLVGSAAGGMTVEFYSCCLLSAAAAAAGAMGGTHSSTTVVSLPVVAIAFYGIRLQGSFVLFWLVFYLTLCVGIGESSWPQSM